MATLSSLLGSRWGMSRGYIDGLILSNDAGDTEHDIEVSVGACRDKDDSGDIELTSAITKRIDASWSAGDGNGGLDTGSVAADTWYHVFAMMVNGVADACFSTSASAPTMSPGPIYRYRRIGSVLTDGSANIIAFTQFGDQFLWMTPMEDANAVSVGTSAVTCVLSVPNGIQVLAICNWTSTFKSATTHYAYFSSPDVTDNAVTSPSTTHQGPGATEPNDIGLNLRTDTSAQVRIRASVTGSAYYINTAGWIDLRGKDA